MNGEEIKPQYKVVCGKKGFGIFGMEQTTNETVSIKWVSENEDFAKELAEILNDNKVSVHHAKDVIRDMILEFLE